MNPSCWKHPQPPSAARRGAALLIAIVILTGLLMLGLPFLFTQSASLSGTKTFAHSQIAYIGRDAAENLGVAAGVITVKNYVQTTSGTGGTEQWTSLAGKLVLNSGQQTTPAMPAGWAVQIGDNRFGLDLSKLPGFNGTQTQTPLGSQPANHTIGNAALIGTTIEDEAGKLDPNSLTVAGWDTLFKQVGIDDWDDNASLNGKAAFNGSQWVAADDADNYGELARAMAEVRLILPGRRITQLEQLLLADTGYWQDSQGGFSGYPSSSQPPHFGLRRPLTRSELEVLRPYLTLHNPSQGRGSANPALPTPTFGFGKEAVIDVGTIIFADPPIQNITSDWTYYLDSANVNGFDHSSTTMVAHTKPTLLGMGTWLMTDQVDTSGPNRGMVKDLNNGLNIQASNNSTTVGLLYANNTPNTVALAIEAPPPVNINAAPVAVLNVVGVPIKPTAPVMTQDALKNQGQSNYTLQNNVLTPFQLQNPLGSGYLTTVANERRLVELPPVAIASPGIVSVTSSAAVMDAQNHQTAQEIRHTVIQAMPQETVVERRWLTQGHFNALLAQRYGSNLEAWPNPYRRLQFNTGDPLTTPDDPDLSAGGSVANNTGLRPAVQPSEATGYGNRTEVVIAPQFAPTIAPVGTYQFGQGMPQHFLVSQNFTLDWRLPFGGDIAVTPANLMNEVFSGQTALMAGGGTYDENDLRPDGLLLKSSMPLVVQLTDDTTNAHGLLRRTNFQLPDNNALRGWEIAGRHLHFWITPQSDWATGITPLLEARIPQGHAGGPLITAGQVPAPGSGNSDLQNYMGLFYDRTQQLLVLVFAPPAIEHLVDYGKSIPADDTTTTFDLDERCLGNDASGPLQPLAPKQVADAGTSGTSARLATVSALYKPNRIIHCFKVPDTNGKPYFHQGQSYHIELALSNDHPGGSAIIVDGCVGRDVGRDQSTGGTLSLFGDHCSLPALTLATAIPFTDITTVFGAGLQLPTITVNPVAGLSAQDLFPVRGMIKIDDEYFTYQSVTGNTFNTCVRGQRQNSVTFGATPISRWPVTEAHSAGAYVTPGGYRLSIGYPATTVTTPTGGSRPRYLYTGSGTLAAVLPNGDPSPTLPGGLPNGNQWMVWGRVDATKIPPLKADPNDLTGQTLDLFPNAPTPTAIPLDPSQGVISQFPPRGVIVINGHYLAYSSIAGNNLSGITDITGWNMVPGPNPGTAITVIQFNKNNPPYVYLQSIEMTGSDPTAMGTFCQGGFRPGADMFIQVMHGTTGRVEWIRYDQIASGAGAGMGYYFLNLGGNGFNVGDRGQQRTDFVGRVKPDPVNIHTTLTPTSTFPAGSTVLPIQSELAPAGHYIATGDVITVLPKAQMTGNGTGLPQQMVVRYAAMDGYDVVDSKRASNDTYNELFAFNDVLPTAYNQQDASIFEFLSWPGWSGNDLTNPMNAPLNSLGSPHGYLPRIDDLADGYAPPARTCLAAVDLQHGGGGANITSTADASIDGIVAGPLPANNATTVGDIAAWVSPSSVYNGTDSAPLLNGIDATVGSLSTVKVRTAENIFFTPMGLILIGGEVFAFDRDSNPTGAKTTEALLVGRALLGSSAIAHNGQESFDILPLGPVARLDGTLPAGGTTATWLQLFDATLNGTNRHVTFDAPTAMLLDPSGSIAGAQSLELINLSTVRMQTNPPNTVGAAAQPWYGTAPQMRGLYNTISRAWSPTNGLSPIVVGWWPRYASALPNSELSIQHYRCRSYAWVGFPLSMTDARFDPTTFGSFPVATVSILDSQTTNEFQIEAHALATGFDWSTTPAATLTNNASTDQDASGAFNQSQFTNVAVNGAELRILWRYVPATSDTFPNIAAASNSAPTIGPVRLRALVPAKILSITQAR